jgi:hypothetical protein
LLSNVNACCHQWFFDTVFPELWEVATDFSSPHAIVAALVFGHVPHYKSSFFIIAVLDKCVPHVHFASIVQETARSPLKNTWLDYPHLVILYILFLYLYYKEWVLFMGLPLFRSFP